MNSAHKTKKSTLRKASIAHGPFLAIQSGHAQQLLAWYDVHGRILPWRAPKGERPDAYQVWLSEIMLQQTTVKTVATYYHKFLKAWPDVSALARAKRDDVLAAWAGLGYYARARNLHNAAQMVATQLGGKFPDTMEGLRALPGIGRYSAGAIAAIVYNEKKPAMDANAERVIARLFGVQTPLPKAKNELYDLCRALIPDRAGDFVQALMDLGAMICTPKQPDCARCPWSTDCRAHQSGTEDLLPFKLAKGLRVLKRGAAFVAKDEAGSVLLVRRPDAGLLAQMLQPPLGPWKAQFPSKAQAIKQAPFVAAWRKRAGLVRHSFTHFALEIEVFYAHLSHRPLQVWIYPFGSGGRDDSKNRQERNRLGRSGRAQLSATPGDTIMWVPQGALNQVALPSVMRKIIEHGLQS